MSDYRNYQLLTSGFIAPPTENVIIDINLDASYEIFKINIFDLVSDGGAIMNLQMAINGDGTNNYRNMLDGSLIPGQTCVILSPSTGANRAVGSFSMELTIYININGRTPIYINGFSTYLSSSSGLLERYQIGAVWNPPNPPNMISNLTYVCDPAVNFISGRYVSYGLSARGASQLYSTGSGG